MGIKQLFDVIKIKCPEQILEFSLSQWRGYSFAIDISIFLNKFVKSAGDKYWMNNFFIFFCILKKHGIKAVAVFDGSNFPIEKKIEQESRRANIDKAKKRLKKAKKIRDMLYHNYLPENEKDIPESIQTKCKIIVGPKRKIPRVVNWADALEVYEILSDLIESVEKQISPITNDQREKAWEITQMMGIPTFQADGEAEALCAYMVMHGYADAVLSEDSDVLAYGSTWMVAFKDYKLSDEKIRAIHLPSVLKAMEYTMEEFRDLCILLSCDYNNRVKGFLPDENSCKKKKNKNPVNIGCIGAIKMIDHYRTLENCEPHIEDITPLIYPRCRELFTPITTEEMQKLIQICPYSIKPDFDKIKQFITDNRLSVSIAHIETCWRPAEIIFHDSSASEECI